MEGFVYVSEIPKNAQLVIRCKSNPDDNVYLYNGKLYKKLIKEESDYSDYSEEEEEDDLTTDWEPLTGYEDYEIRLVDGNAEIRKIKTKHPQKFTKDKRTGYVTVCLNGRPHKLHKVMALHYINYASDDMVVDHIDRNKLNNNIKNLRWVTQQENSRNKSSNKGIVYNHVKELPPNAKPIKNYKGRTIKNVYYSDDIFYFYNGSDYRIMHKHINKNGSYYVNTRDVNGKVTAICRNKLML